MKHKEIALAGCLGAVAGTAVAIVCEFGLLMLLPSALIGALTAFLCYRPLEVVTTVRECSCDLKRVMQTGLQKFRVERGRLLMGMHIFACTVVAIGAVFLLPILIFGGDTNGGIVTCVALVSFIVGYFAVGIFCVGLQAIEKHWLMPLTRRMERSIIHHRGGRWLHRSLNDPDALETKGQVFLFCLIGPMVAQVVALPLSVVLCTDIVLTILLACATSERVAAILGATLGLCTGTVLHFCGISSSLAILAASGIVGWYAGPLLYDLREYLSTVPVTETVRS